MDQKIYFAYRKLPLTFITLIIFTTSANQVLALDPKFNACEPKSCGQGPNISYPFWLPQGQESFCGYPNFEISCKGENPVLAISNDDYIIKDIFYTNHSFLVANSAAYEDACPISLHNLSLDRTSFNICPGYTSFSFFYNCLSSPPNFTYPLTCASNYTHSSFASLDLEMLELYHNDVLETCEDVVNTPVDTGGDFGTLFTANYSDILKMGFLLNWTAHNCSTCQTSGGRCGFENNQFICFCRDQPRLQSCDVGDRVNIKRKVIVGVCTAVVSVIIMCLIFFIYQRRKKNQYASSSFVSRSTGSYLSSKGDMEKGMSSSFSVRVNLFSYEELEEATKNFASDRELGDGGFGTVYYGRLKDGREVAVKRLYENNYKRVEQFMNEVEILTRLRHQHLVALYGCTSRHSRELLLVYEYIPNGTVADNLHGEKAKPGALKWPTRLNIAIETATALSYLHATDIIHRDVKTNNILLDKNFGVKVADFGLSRLFPNDVSHISTAPQGTPGYVDPEYHQCYQLTSKSDVYSFGVVLIELISSLPAVDITRHRHDINLSNMAISKIQSNTLHEIIDPSLGFESNETTKNMIYAVAELAFQCLQSEKEARPSMEEVLGTLLEIQNEDNSTKKTDVVDVRSDDVVLLKKGRPLSPVSVTEKWISISSTPNTSG